MPRGAEGRQHRVVQRLAALPPLLPEPRQGEEPATAAAALARVVTSRRGPRSPSKARCSGVAAVGADRPATHPLTFTRHHRHQNGHARAPNTPRRSPASYVLCVEMPLQLISWTQEATGLDLFYTGFMGLHAGISRVVEAHGDAQRHHDRRRRRVHGDVAAAGAAAAASGLASRQKSRARLPTGEQRECGGRQQRRQMARKGETRAEHGGRETGGDEARRRRGRKNREGSGEEPDGQHDGEAEEDGARQGGRGEEHVPVRLRPVEAGPRGVAGGSPLPGADRSPGPGPR